MNIDDTLAERGARYGDFTDHARVAQALQNALRVPAGWQACSDVQKQALTVICDKMARIVTGDPNYADNWHDVQGYSKLVEDRLPEASTKPKAVDGWIDWNGGKCPVRPDVCVEVRFADGVIGEDRADTWGWSHEPNVTYNIVAYRVIKD